MARFEEIEERLARVPERRWMMMADEGQTWRIGYRGRGNSFWMPDSMTDEAALVAHAAEDIEWLLAELRRTRVERGDALHFRDEYHSQLADEQKRAEAAEAEVRQLQAKANAADGLRTGLIEAQADVVRLRWRLALAKRQCIGGSCKVRRIITE